MSRVNIQATTRRPKQYQFIILVKLENKWEEIGLELLGRGVFEVAEVCIPSQCSDSTTNDALRMVGTI